MKSGIILWKKQTVTKGLVFRKPRDKFEVITIAKKYIDQVTPFEKFSDSFKVFKNYIPDNRYKLSHDFDMVWIYFTNMRTDTVCRKISEVIGGGDQTGRNMYLKFEKLYYLSMPPLKIPRRKKVISK